MIRTIDEHTITDAVIDQMSATHDARLKALDSGEHEVEPAGSVLPSGFPTLQLGESIAENCPGDVIGVYGRVLSGSGHSIAHASIEVWQPERTGFTICRNRTLTRWSFAADSLSDEEGGYFFRTIKPRGYKVPMDEPVGDMVRAQGRHGWRPAHIHFLVGAPGYREAITALYMADDEHIDSDTTFGANDSLITAPKQGDPTSRFGVG